jgi:hypothetical protein
VNITTLFAILDAGSLVVAGVVKHVENAMGNDDGPAKRARAIALLKEEGSQVGAALGIPQALLGFMLNDAILGYVVDKAVAAANAAGLFTKKAA